MLICIHIDRDERTQTEEIFCLVHDKPFEDDNEIDNTLVIVTSWDVDDTLEGPIVWERYDFDESGNFIFIDTDYRIYAPEEEYDKRKGE